MISTPLVKVHPSGILLLQRHLLFHPKRRETEGNFKESDSSLMAANCQVTIIWLMMTVLPTRRQAFLHAVTKLVVMVMMITLEINLHVLLIVFVAASEHAISTLLSSVSFYPSKSGPVAL